MYEKTNLESYLNKKERCISPLKQNTECFTQKHREAQMPQTGYTAFSGV